MIFSDTQIEGVVLLDVEKREDERGFFGRIWCREEMAAHGAATELAQCSVAQSRKAGTLRGLHYQDHPHWEEKLVRCTRGAVFVVALDLRTESPTHRRWVGTELTAGSYRMVYVPQGCAQGYQTLEDDTELVYQMSKPYVPESARGVRYDDAAFGIVWPRPVAVISEADRNWPDYRL